MTPTRFDRSPSPAWSAGYADGDPRSSRNYDSLHVASATAHGADEVVRARDTASHAYLLERAYAQMAAAGMDVGGIVVEISPGWLTLRGEVPDTQAGLVAEQLVSQLPGGRQTRNALTYAPAVRA